MTGDVPISDPTPLGPQPAKTSKYHKRAKRGGGPDNPTCAYKGVSQRRSGKWVAEIYHPKMRSRLWLGTYSTAEDAARVYDSVSIDLYGSKAHLNLGGSSPRTTCSPPSPKPHNVCPISPQPPPPLPVRSGAQVVPCRSVPHHRTSVHAAGVGCPRWTHNSRDVCPASITETIFVGDGLGFHWE